MLMPTGLNPGSYTPFTADNKLDAKALERELQLVTKGSTGLHGPAGHSEFASLTFDEFKLWTDVLVDVAHRNGLKAWPFLGSESFEKTLPYADYALQAGADGFYVIAPYFNLYSQEAGYQYYRDLAAEYPDTPMVFYPSHQTGNHFTPDTIARIAAIPNIVGMKLNGDSSFDELGRIVMLTKERNDFNWIAGGLNVLYPFFSHIQMKSSSSPMSNFAHEWSLNLWTAYLAQDWPRVEHWKTRLGRIQRVMNVVEDRHVGGRAGHKAALAILGRPVGQPRRPAIPASAEHIERIRKVFKEEGLI